jgi:hypothetical protein
MTHRTARLTIAGAMIAAPTAIAEVAGGNAPMISPFDDALVTVEWGQDTIEYPGFIRWADPEVPNTWTNILEIPTARPGDHFVLPRTFSATEELVLGYARTAQGATEFSTASPGSDQYVQITAIDSMTFSVRLAGAQPGSGTANAIDHALFLVRFAQMPAPGSPALAVAVLLCVRRRRVPR